MDAILKWQQSISQIKKCIVISDNKNALGLSIAKSYPNVEVMYLSGGDYRTKLVDNAEKKYISVLKKHQVNLVCLAGFMRLLKENFIQSFPRQILNIHPSLLPKYRGLNTHERVLANRETETGCTIHFVDIGMDTGEIIRQKKVPIAKNDTAETLSQKVLQAEHRLYCDVLQDIVDKKIPIG